MFDVGAEIRCLRKRKGLTQQDLADIFHTSLSRVSKIENNKLDITAREYLEWKEQLSKVEKVASFKINRLGGSKVV
ncbi:helix-turn-helix domain-containing protein [Paenibacillus tarimensis]